MISSIAEIWSSPDLGAMVQGAPGGIFTAFGGASGPGLDSMSFNNLGTPVIGNDDGLLYQPVPVDKLLIAPGERYDVTVSSIGDASSLEGGNLVMTSLKAADGTVVMVARLRPTLSLRTFSTRARAWQLLLPLETRRSSAVNSWSLTPLMTMRSISPTGGAG